MENLGRHNLTLQGYEDSHICHCYHKFEKSPICSGACREGKKEYMGVRHVCEKLQNCFGERVIEWNPLILSREFFFNLRGLIV